jgi:ribosome-associated heat shock protein Hsp15
MRIDLCLSGLCLFKTRSQAGRACDEGKVWLNGQQARSAKDVHPGDRIRFTDRLGRIEQEVEVLVLPEGSVSRAAAHDMYRLIARRVLDDPWGGPPAQAE